MTRAISRVAIIGAGTMGAGIAITAVMAGLPVSLIDRSDEVLARAVARLDAYLRRQVEKGAVASQDVTEMKRNLHTSTELSAAASADLIIEAVFERLDVKTALLSELEPQIPPDSLIATNTSCLRVSVIAKALRHRGRFLGLHYFSPAEVNPLVELVRGDETDPSATEALTDFLKATKRVVLPCSDAPGFVVNRFFCPYVNEAVRCYHEGLATTSQIDRIACSIYGQPLGPFATCNLVGLPVMLHALENLAHLGPLYEPAALLREKVAAGSQWQLDTQSADPSSRSSQQIAARLTEAVRQPIRELLAEGVADAATVDLGAVHALRFAVPPARDLRQLDAQAAIAQMMCRFGGL